MYPASSRFSDERDTAPNALMTALLKDAGLPGVEIEELKQRMKALEQGSEDTIAAINDLSEDTRRELDDIYLALSQLANKQKQAPTDRRPIGFTEYDKE